MKEFGDMRSSFEKQKGVIDVPFIKKTGLNSRGQSLKHLVLWWQRNILAKEGPRGLPIKSYLEYLLI